MSKPILCLDFDGVIHSYRSGWQGPAVIPDPPVPGALQFIIDCLDHFSVAIFSSRSHQLAGIAAMKNWLHGEFMLYGPDLLETNSAAISNHIAECMRAGLPYDDLWDAMATFIVDQIQFPTTKPPAFVGIDDRVLTFTGAFPDVEELKAFKPWNKQ